MHNLGEVTYLPILVYTSVKQKQPYRERVVGIKRRKQDLYCTFSA